MRPTALPSQVEGHDWGFGAERGSQGGVERVGEVGNLDLVVEVGTEDQRTASQAAAGACSLERLC